MNRYVAFVLLLQCFIKALQSDTINPANPTKMTWREILPDYCGLRKEPLREKMMELNIGQPPVSDDGKKITGGKITTIEDHPWQVAILSFPEMTFKCGGSIISKYHVLTAAHCFIRVTTEQINNVTYKSTATVSYRSRRVAVGTSRIRETKLLYNISEVEIHDFYSDSHYRNDIALIKIDGEFVWSVFVWPICLPVEEELYNNGRDCQISGFGALGTAKKNHDGWLFDGGVQLKIESICKYKIEKTLSVKITEGMFCASGQLDKGAVLDSCEGDSGGPLNCEQIDGQKRILLGITSFGYGCGLEHYPGIYTKVSKHLQWIHDRLDVSLGHRDVDSLPEDDDVGRPTDVSLQV